jgi:hypothetical protein
MSFWKRVFGKVDEQKDESRGRIKLATLLYHTSDLSQVKYKKRH